jgi:predicted acyl esterase
MCIWEGAADWYRDMTHHGGILSTFWKNWYDMQVMTVQYGCGERGKRSRATGQLVCGDELLSDAELAANRCDFGAMVAAHPLDDAYHRERRRTGIKDCALSLAAIGAMAASTGNSRSPALHRKRSG